MHRKLIGQYYVLSFLFSAAGLQVISAVYVTFLLKHGLSLLEVNLVNAVFFLTLFVCEIPTGAFADIFGRKTSFVLACGLVSLSMFIYGASHRLGGFIITEILAAIGMTFRSGAFQAWLVDSLKQQDYQGSYAKVFGREGLFNQLGGGLGAIVGSYLAVQHPALPWFVAGIVMFLVMLLAWLTMKESYFIRHSFSAQKGVAAMKEVALMSFHYARTDRTVRFVLVITFVQIYAVQAINMYWQPFFRNLKIKEEHLGFLFTGMLLSIAIGSFLASQLQERGTEKRTIVRLMILVGLLVASAALSTKLYPALLLFFLHEVGRGWWGVVKDSYLQERIPSSERATITSFCAIAPHIGGVIGLILSGVIAQFGGITLSWVGSGLVLIVGALLIRRNGNAPD